ncbi:hypothetical protein IM660_00900 [Ruania alkalisoli]|uniref:Asp23/Gls24 family envelope stress response protein n=1 Tax=Ruania alkalisoli TaxID=2779775 RepID=A0A7M1STW0_9MICO|nr:hypothetical protein [Ruania alkalisoli]QOR70911.1 hypothetical protein IM660_00900 [Ruania alkalisoli]
MAEVPGTTTIADRVIVRLAEQAAAEASRDGRTGDRPKTRAHADVAGQRARVQVETSTYWPEPVATAGARIAERVRHDLAVLAQVRADHVEVKVVTVLPPSAPIARSIR